MWARGSMASLLALAALLTAGCGGSHRSTTTGKPATATSPTAPAGPSTTTAAPGATTTTATSAGAGTSTTSAGASTRTTGSPGRSGAGDTGSGAGALPTAHFTRGRFVIGLSLSYGAFERFIAVPAERRAFTHGAKRRAARAKGAAAAQLALAQLRLAMTAVEGNPALASALGAGRLLEVRLARLHDDLARGRPLGTEVEGAQQAFTALVVDARAHGYRVYPVVLGAP